ncbi:MAG: HhH-GPD-type base excision DNA repair protein [Acidimicrobiia bacterium]
MATAVLPVTGDLEADELLVTDPFALLVGMLLDQQVPMEWAFRGPLTLRERLGHLDPRAIAAMSVDDFEAICREKPAIHRYPGSMGKRTHALAVHVVDTYDGDAAAIWTTTNDPVELFARLRALPGYGEEKAKIFLAILGKRLHVAPKGWEQAASPFSDQQPRSVADIDSPEGLQRVRAFKQAKKAKGKSKAE